MRRLNYVVSAALVWVMASVRPGELASQSIWLEPHGDRVAYLEILKPSFEDGDDIAFLTSAWYLSTRVALSDNIAVVGEVPFAYAKIDSEFTEESQSGTTIGNIYAGLELTGGASKFFGEFGVRVPLASDEGDGGLASEAGFLADYVDRAEAFLPNVLSIHAAVNYRLRQENGVGVRFRLAPLLWIDTESDGAEVELWTLYSAQVWYNGEMVAVGGGFSGRALLTEEDLDFGERSFHQICLAANLILGRFQPGVQLRVPVDKDYSDIVNTVVGLSVGYRW
ncbi:MAG: hypothetical protein JSV86_15885 [Gemmatimonadota bacterium]|nr:MAG: hypothetical protein JSV86_15885 [Gemmatimonadota bacterium]